MERGWKVPRRERSDEEIAAAAKALTRRQRGADDEPRLDQRRNVVRHSLRRLRRKKREVIDAMKDAPCADCGGRFHPVVMDFDHRDGEQKLFNVSAAIPLGLSIDRIRAEVAKCDVVCANCHRMRTHRRAEAARVEVVAVPDTNVTCRRGHPRTPENTRVRLRDGRQTRECRDCEREAAEKRARRG